MITNLTRKAGSNMGNHWIDVVVHVLKVLNICGMVMEERPCPPLKKKQLIGQKPKWSTEESYFADSQFYLDLFQRMEDTYKSSKITLSSNKFNEMVSVTISLLASLVRNVGRPIVMYAAEIIQFLVQQFFTCVDKVSICVKDLFVNCLRNDKILETESQNSDKIDSNAHELVNQHQTQKPSLGFFEHFVNLAKNSTSFLKYTAITEDQVPESVPVLRRNVQFIESTQFRNAPKIIENPNSNFPTEIFPKQQVDKVVV